MDPMTQVLLAVTIPTAGALVGVLVSNSRINDMNVRISDVGERMERISENLVRHIDKRTAELRAELRRVEEMIAPRLKHLEERIR